jgi:hypothetical protein
MTSSALTFYRDTIEHQLGEDSPITEQAIIDPTGESLTVYGVLDDHTYPANKDGGNAMQRLNARRFIIADPLTLEIHEDVQIYFPLRDLLLKIQLQETDLQGAQVLWVY